MYNNRNNYELIKFSDGDLSLDVKISPSDCTIWLTANQIAFLLDRDSKTIRKHIKSILNEELDNSVVANFATTASDGKSYNITYYNLDMILAVGYRVKSN